LAAGAGVGSDRMTTRANSDMNEKKIKRVLFYTHNSIGLGHAVRTLAIITGMRRADPDLEFLVLSGTSVPQLFSREGIEIIKLPSTRMEFGPEGAKLKPRYLRSVPLEQIYDFRQAIITEAFQFFEPQALMIEHNMTGQMNELVPLQLKKYMRRGGRLDFAMCYFCRGIMSRGPLLRIPYQNPRHGSESVNIGQLYDFIYVLEDRDIIDVNREFLGNDPDMEPKIRYLGKITSKARSEIAPRAEVLEAMDLPDKPIILMTLGRHGEVQQMADRILNTMDKEGLWSAYQVILVLDPYLEKESVAELRETVKERGGKAIPFTPDLLDLIAASELIICRAGYNTVNEVLLTDTKALIIAEDHAGGEQEFRIKSLPGENIEVLHPSQTDQARLDELIPSLLKRRAKPLGYDFDKYAIGRSLAADLQAWWKDRMG
jgi:predicted glycosyltransferase